MVTLFLHWSQEVTEEESMGRKRADRQEKIEAVEAVNAGMSIADVSRVLGRPCTTISNWLADGEFNPDGKYVRLRKGRKGLGRHRPKDPFPEGVEMAADRDPEELAREVRDLRRKNAYLEDRAAYLQALFETVGEDPLGIAKKNDAGRSRRSSGRDMGT